MRDKTLVLIMLLMLPVFIGQQVGVCRTNDMRTRCDNCHTMHNSSGNSVMTVGGIGNQERLLTNNCYGCHAGANSAGSRPYVTTSVAGAPDYGTTGTSAAGVANGTLAGGSFYWVAQGQDNMGHNVDVLTTQASRNPPGDASLLFDSTNPLTCAGANGCHGTGAASEAVSMYRTHHADDTLSTDGSSLARSYRLLNGISGIEDSDYEFTVSANDHNQYNGVVRNADDDPDTSTMSHLCARCHGDFHSGLGNLGVDDVGFATPWVRHPVDIDLSGVLGTEYSGYGGAGVNLYMVETPLASDITAGELIAKTIKSNVLQAAGDAIITCVSCHRAHGSPYDSSLRWDYRQWPGAGYNGCGDCHTAKD